ncbi:hypothetical protein HDV00_009894 [Rhizophlyctis rosea]|nr:hypothetical protein HDV00_009894 [Rhizophlyctis rosea]
MIINWLSKRNYKLFSGILSIRSMDSEDQPIETSQLTKSHEEPPKKKRQISPEQKKVMMENLAKAREARAANRVNLSKYPKEKRARTKELYEADIEKKAEEKARKLAQELLEKEKQEAELLEFRKWKEEQRTQKEQRGDPEAIQEQENVHKGFFDEEIIYFCKECHERKTTKGRKQEAAATRARGDRVWVVFDDA